MKVLLLHDLPPVERIRRQLINQAFFYFKYRPSVDLVLHGVGDPLDNEVTQSNYDAIFLDVSLLCWRWAKPRSLLFQMLKRYSWVAQHPAPKIAFPQDDYDHQQILDDWLHDWNVDVVFTPLPAFKDILYPRTSTKAEIQAFQTGFIDDVDLHIGEVFNSRLEDRPVDVVYRARPLPANFGRLGELKTLVARHLTPLLLEAGFRTDISTDPTATIFGDQWLKFLGSSRFVLGTPSGSSVLDPQGEIGECIARCTSERPSASFDEVYALCVPEVATRHWMAAISPRVLEAALTRTCQVLVRGEYGPLEPDQHYIPLEPDFSNADEVVERMRDLAEAQNIVDNCYETVISNPALHYRYAADRVDVALDKVSQARGNTPAAKSSAFNLESVIEQHIVARLRERQRLILGAANDFGQNLTGVPIEVVRHSEVVEAVADRWKRLELSYDNLSASYQALSGSYQDSAAANNDLVEQVDNLSSQAVYLSSQVKVLNDTLGELVLQKEQINIKYSALYSEFENLSRRPGALMLQLYKILKGALLRSSKGTS